MDNIFFVLKQNNVKFMLMEREIIYGIFFPLPLCELNKSQILNINNNFVSEHRETNSDVTTNF